MYLQMVLGKVDNLLGKILTACSIDCPVSHRHGGGVTDDDIVGAVGDEFFPHLFSECIPDIGGDGYRNRIEVQGIEVDCNNCSLALDQFIMGIERPRPRSCPYIQDGIAALDELETLLQLFKFVDGACRVAFLVCTFCIGVCTVSSAGCHI
ncbi:hypothetical protein SDC9_43266 [bioreactor metagenome]|uniref:Uncharacterized protein n=1 Tax=bioreactor metagenome TaxID=1076179 RepID=A0A644W0J4_9ZZZZ